MASEHETRLREAEGGKTESLIAGKILEFGGLIGRNAAILLLCKERGIVVERQAPIADARSALPPFRFEAKIERIFPMQKFEGSRDRSIRIYLSDKTSKATLVLWNEQADEVSAGVAVGDIVEVSRAYFRSGEIGIGREGHVKRKAEFAKTPLGALAEGPASTSGKVSSIEPEFSDGRKERGFAFSIGDGKSSVRVVAWQEGGATFERPKVGDEVLLENAYFRKGELHLSSVSRLRVLSSESKKKGVITSLEIENGRFVLRLGKEMFTLGIDEGLLLFGIKLPQGVEASTLRELLEPSLIGKTASYTLEDGKLLELIVEKEKEKKEE
jgi:hypothetical protein